MGGRGLGADRVIHRVELAGQRGVHVAAGGGDPREARGLRLEDTGRHDVGEAGVVAADGDRDEVGRGGERSELARRHVTGAGTRAGGEGERGGGVGGRPERGVGEGAALAVTAGADVAAGTDPRGVGVAQRDVVDGLYGRCGVRGGCPGQGDDSAEQERGRERHESGHLHGTSLGPTCRISAYSVVAAAEAFSEVSMPSPSDDLSSRTP